MSLINEIFLHKVCINLDWRPEKWNRMHQRFEEHGLENVTRFSAIDGRFINVPSDWRSTPGAYGCLASNLEVIRQARAHQWPSVLIFEDDVVFADRFASKFGEAYPQLPPDWDMLFLGGMHRSEPERISKNILKLSGSTATYAYAVRRTIYDDFLEIHSNTQTPLDVNNRFLQERFNCYCFYPHLAWVEKSHSDTHGRVVDPWWLKESLILGGSEMDRMQSGTLVVIPHRDRTPSRIGVRNLLHSIKAYRRLFPDSTIVVVEQDLTPSLGSNDLIENCAYLAIPDGRPLNRGRCFNEAVKRFGAQKDFYILTDADISVGWDMRANLRLCLDYDFANCFDQIIDLSPDDSARVVKGMQVHGESYKSRSRGEICSEFCTITRRGFEKLGGWDERAGPEADRRQSELVMTNLSVFESTAVAFRLFSGVENGEHAAVHVPQPEESNGRNWFGRDK